MNVHAFSTAIAGALAVVACGCTERPQRLDAGRSIHNSMNMRQIAASIQSYRSAYGRWPGSLSEALLNDRSRGPETALVHPEIPIIAGSQPPTSYHFIQPGDRTSSTAILVYPNIRGDPDLLVVARVDGTLDGLTPQQYAQELNVMGIEHDRLPEPSGAAWRWGVVAAGVAAMLLAGLWIAVSARRRRPVAPELREKGNEPSHENSNK